MALKELTPTKTQAHTISATHTMTYEEYLDWIDDNTHAEWVNGEVIQFMPAKPLHQLLEAFLYELMASFVRLFNLGTVLIPPLEMKLADSSREPDIIFIAQENIDRLTKDRLDGPADLVVEIVSNESVRRDRQDKFYEYRDAGIREYWIIDPREGKQRADFYHLSDDGEYQLFATEDDEQVFSQVLAGFWLRPSWLWQVEELDPFLAFCELRGLSAEQAQQIQQLLKAQPLVSEDQSVGG